MKRYKNLCIAGAFLALIGAWAAFVIWLCQPPVDEYAAHKNLGGIMLSRGGIRDAQKFKDDTYMHGLSYYYFPADPPAVNRLVSWLELEKSEKATGRLPEMARAAASRNGWQFDCTNPQVYVAHYCNPDEADGTYTNTDLLLVSNGKSIYVTRGYHSERATRTADLSACENPRTYAR